METFSDLVYKYNRGQVSTEAFCIDLNPPEYSVETYGYKEHRKSLPDIWKPLAGCERIKDAELLYTPCFISTFYTLVWAMLKITGYSTENLYEFLPEILQILRYITREDYIITNCPNPEPYYCGRAFIVIERGAARFLIFDTVPPDEMNPVTIDRYGGIEDSYKPNNAPLQCSSSKRLNKEIQRIQALKYTIGVSYYYKHPLVHLRIETICGCSVDLTIPDCDAYPHKGVQHLYVNDIAYTPLHGKDWSPAMSIVDLVDQAHQASGCRKFTTS